MVVHIGIDYSISCPAMTVHDGDTWSYNNCKFFYLINKKKSLVSDNKFTGEAHKKFESQQERFDQISEFFLEHIKKYKNIELISLEGYSFGSTGQIFNIAENTEVLKYKLYKDKYDVITVPPTTIKKFGSGKGNASKLQMDAAFRKETDIDMSKILNCQTADSPSQDVVDSYFICKYGFFNKNKTLEK